MNPASKTKRSKDREAAQQQSACPASQGHKSNPTELQNQQKPETLQGMVAQTLRNDIQDELWPLHMHTCEHIRTRTETERMKTVGKGAPGLSLKRRLGLHHSKLWAMLTASRTG